MKPTARHLLIAIVALALGAIPAIALAQSPFRDYKDAAADQYGTTTSPTSSTPAGTVDATVSTPVVTATVGATVGAETQAPPTPEEEAANPPSQGENNPQESGAGASPRSAAGAAAGGAAAGEPGPSCNRYAIIGLSPLLMPAVPDVVLALGKAAYVADITEPLKTKVLKQLTDGTEWAGAATDNKKLRGFARALGASVPDVGPLAKAAFPKLAKFPEFPPASGITDQDFEPVAGIVLTHVQVPLKGAANSRRNTFVKWFIKGLQSAKVPDVQGGETDLPLAGVEEKVTKKTEISFFKKYGVSSVDDTDLDDGKLSLVRVMFGAVGHFGIKKSADNGKLAQPSSTVEPLLCRPDNKYVAGKLLRSTDDGIPGGGPTIAVLMLLGLAGAVSLLAIVERRTRRVRRSRSGA
jgi:hypothetical protein